MNLEGMSLKKKFWRFVWPSVVAQWIFALYTMVDGMFVARGVSEVALSAVNIASPFVNFLFSVSILFAVGTSTVVAIFLGQGRHREANQANTQNMVVTGVLSLFIMLMVWLCLDPIVSFLGATQSTQEYVKHYILSLLPFTWWFIISYTFETLVKTDGFPRFAAAAVASGALVNCFLGPKATIRFARPVWDLGQFIRVVKIGLSSGFTELSAGFTVFMFNHAILRYIGEQGVVSYTIIAYVNTIVVMSMAGIAQGIQPLISFHYGRQERDVCSRLLKYSLTASVGVAGIAFISSMAGADWLVGIFISEKLEGLRQYSASVFRIFSLSFLVVGFNITGAGYFTAIERPKESLIISLGRGMVIIAASLAVCIGVGGGEGIWWAPAVSELMCLGVTLILVYLYTRRETFKCIS